MENFSKQFDIFRTNIPLSTVKINTECHRSNIKIFLSNYHIIYFTSHLGDINFLEIVVLTRLGELRYKGQLSLGIFHFAHLIKQFFSIVFMLFFEKYNVRVTLLL